MTEDMGYMSFKKESYLWIVVLVIFLYIWVETESVLSALLFTGIVLGSVYLLYIVLIKFFN